MTHKNNFFDIHSHILFDIDDGPKELLESLCLLDVEKKLGARAVAVTPHFYANQMDLEEFFKVSNQCFNALVAACDNEKPKLILGCEVCYFRNISKAEAIADLTYGNSKYMLLEMVSPISDTAIEEVKELYYAYGLKPILAHLERYHKKDGYKGLLKLIEDGFVKAQVNASSFADKAKRKEALNLIKNGYADFLASDTHSVKLRPPQFENAFEIIKKQLGEDALQKLIQNSQKLYCEITGEEWE